jgi:hypothetical protein
MMREGPRSRIQNHSRTPSGILGLESDIPAQIILKNHVDLESLKKDLHILFSDAPAYGSPIYLRVFETIFGKRLVDGLVLILLGTLARLSRSSRDRGW